MRTVCTIITPDYVPFAKVLGKSLQKFIPDIVIQVLIVDEVDISSNKILNIHPINSVINSPLSKEIFKKYAYTNLDRFRWALKPIFIDYLLKKGFNKVIYADHDLFFVNNYEFLFKYLEEDDILLTPHWANINPLQNEKSLLDVLQGGMYNAGFIGVNKKAEKALNWWAEVCHYKIERNQPLGLFDDQKYLDVLPAQFDNVKIIKHQGCNLASWNIESCKREMVSDKLMINRKFEPVFIHFNRETIANIFNGNDEYLQSFLDEYTQLLKAEGFDLYNNRGNLDFSKFYMPYYIVKRKLLIRTRIKRWLFRLAQKI